MEGDREGGREGEKSTHLRESEAGRGKTLRVRMRVSERAKKSMRAREHMTWIFMFIIRTIKTHKSTLRIHNANSKHTREDSKHIHPFTHMYSDAYRSVCPSICSLCARTAGSITTEDELELHVSIHEDFSGNVFVSFC